MDCLLVKKKINISHFSFSLTMAMYHKLFCLRGNMRTFFFIKDKSGRWLMMRPASLLKSSKRVFFVTFRLARILCNGCIAVLCPCINSESNAEKINRQFHFNSLSMKWFWDEYWKKIDNVFKILCACTVFSRKKYPVGSERHWFIFI